MRILLEKRRLFLLVLTFTFSSDGLKTKLRKHVRRKSQVTDAASDKEGTIHIAVNSITKLDLGSIRSSLRDGLSTPYRLTKEQC